MQTEVDGMFETLIHITCKMKTIWPKLPAMYYPNTRSLSVLKSNVPHHLVDVYNFGPILFWLKSVLVLCCACSLSFGGTNES